VIAWSENSNLIFNVFPFSPHSFSPKMFLLNHVGLSSFLSKESIGDLLHSLILLPNSLLYYFRHTRFKFYFFAIMLLRTNDIIVVTVYSIIYL
jgi:hypothetical protein